MKSVKSRITHLFVAAMVLLISWSSSANTESDATAIIESTTSQIMAIVDDAPDYFDADPGRFYDSIGAVLDETIDWRGFAKGVMGEYASNARYRSLDQEGKEALREQLESFTEIIKSGLIRTYAKGLLAFSGSKFEIVADESGEPNARSVSIMQQVYGTGDRTFTVRYQMGRGRTGEWRLRNIIVENINLGQIYQNQFSAAAKSADGDAAKVIAEWDVAANLPEDLDSE